MKTDPSSEQTAAGAINPRSIKKTAKPTSRERRTLQDLAKKVAELAARPLEQEKKDLWYRHNGLQETRPLVFIDPENGWNEIITQDMLECRNPQFRFWEMYLRKEIHWGTVLKDDKVINAKFPVTYDYADSGWGLSQEKIKSDAALGAYTWEAPVKDYDCDFPKLSFPVITVDDNRTKAVLETAREIFDEILEVELRGAWWWTLGMTWDFINLRGLENFMLDMYDNPDDVHRLMAFLRDGTLAKLNFLQENGLLSLNTGGTYVGSGGFGWTNELPAENSGKEPVTTRDMWGFAESQETVGVGPEMFEEFIFPYQYDILDRFGLNCYGCCEGLDKRMHIVKRFPRLRRVSVSPWADKRAMSGMLGKDYIYSLKPKPSPLAQPVLDEDDLRKEMREYLSITRNNHTEIIMKDNHTLGGNSDNARRWVELLREEMDRI